ncbi:ATPase [Sphingomonas hankyongi]|uniref:ATP synthase subunit b n=1 Tax=Sphingomonas hankyongi TaxID=2908209 RepID=A0ABT0RYU4_9SPHN|nr:ATPase [Sphingomonas hankyongi]MCL6728636.1 ATPase [Sphingomonas hankyongi]
MPQIEQLPFIFSSQLFWLAIVFGIIFFGIGRGMLPKIQSTVEAREQKIAEDLERAKSARAEAEETEAAWRARMDAARAEAAKLAQDARQESSRDTEAQVRGAADKISLRVEAAAKQIREAVTSARKEIETVAADATQDMVARLTGITVNEKEAAAAVKAELNV